MTEWVYFWFFSEEKNFGEPFARAETDIPKGWCLPFSKDANEAKLESLGLLDQLFCEV